MIVFSDQGRQAVKRRWQVIIETENQSQIWALYLEAKDVLSKLKAKAYTPYGFGFPFIGFGHSMLPDDPTGSISFVTNVMPLLK